MSRGLVGHDQNWTPCSSMGVSSANGDGYRKLTGNGEANHSEAYLFLGTSKHEPREEENRAGKQMNRWVWKNKVKNKNK